jgi:hypothetical protein
MSVCTHIPQVSSGNFFLAKVVIFPAILNLSTCVNIWIDFLLVQQTMWTFFTSDSVGNLYWRYFRTQDLPGASFNPVLEPSSVLRFFTKMPSAETHWDNKQSVKKTKLIENVYAFFLSCFQGHTSAAARPPRLGSVCSQVATGRHQPAQVSIFLLLFLRFLESTCSAVISIPQVLLTPPTSDAVETDTFEERKSRVTRIKLISHCFLSMETWGLTG